MPLREALSVKFWGVRGSFPTPAASHLGYGGNTSCVEVRAANGTRFIIDAGTGLRSLGLEMQTEPEPEVRFLITHFHGDHLLGLPAFKPLYDEELKITFYSGEPASQTREALERLMGAPYFPVDLATMPGRREYVQVGRQPESIDGVRLAAFPLSHPQGGWGYRLEYGRASVVHASDYEHGSDELGRGLIEAAKGADVLIYDAQYTPDDYEMHKGWGHSTWVEAVRVARAAGVGRLVLFHHDPSRDDAALDEIVKQAHKSFPKVEAAREGATIEVSG